MHRVFGWIVLTTLVIAPLLADAAQVYKCVDPKTKATEYSSSPCTSGDQRTIETVDNAIMDGRAAQREIARQPSQQQGQRALQTYQPQAVDDKSNSQECKNAMTGYRIEANTSVGPTSRDREQHAQQLQSRVTEVNLRCGRSF